VASRTPRVGRDTKPPPTLILPARSRPANTMAHPDQSTGALGTVANFGPVLLPDIIVRSGGSYLYTDGGRRILDWTSGQVRPIEGRVPYTVSGVGTCS